MLPHMEMGYNESTDTWYSILTIADRGSHQRYYEIINLKSEDEPIPYIYSLKTGSIEILFYYRNSRLTLLYLFFHGGLIKANFS